MTDQFYYGTRKHLETFVAAHGSNTPAILLLPVAVPTPSERFKPTFNSSVQRLKATVFDLSRKGVRIELFDPGIGEVEIFKWQESVLSEDEDQGDAHLAASRFQVLAAKVMEKVQEIVNSDTAVEGGN